MNQIELNHARSAAWRYVDEKAKKLRSAFGKIVAPELERIVSGAYFDGYFAGARSNQGLSSNAPVTPNNDTKAAWRQSMIDLNKRELLAWRSLIDERLGEYADAEPKV